SSLSVFPPPARYPPFPYTTLFRSENIASPGPAPHRLAAVLPTFSPCPECHFACWYGDKDLFLLLSSGQGRIPPFVPPAYRPLPGDRKSTRLNSSHVSISYAVFCLK